MHILATVWSLFDLGSVLAYVPRIRDGQHSPGHLQFKKMHLQEEKKSSQAIMGCY